MERDKLQRHRRVTRADVRERFAERPKTILDLEHEALQLSVHAPTELKRRIYIGHITGNPDAYLNDSSDTSVGTISFIDESIQDYFAATLEIQEENKDK